MKRGWIVLSLVVAMVTATGVPSAGAADSAEVADAIAETGVYVEPGVSASEVRIGELVSALRSEGENISMVVLAQEPVGGANTFADAVVRRMGAGLVLVVAPDTIGVSGTSEEFGDLEIDDAVEASFAGETDIEVLEIFTSQLLGTDVAVVVPLPLLTTTQAPTTTTQGPANTAAPGAAGSDSSDGGGSGFLLFVVLAGGGLLLFFWWRRRQSATKGPRLHPDLAEAKEVVQKQINAVANDIIEMEDEVRQANNTQVDEFYEAAGSTYNDVTEAFPTANRPQTLLDLSNKLDEAIWQLDSAEALLDGKSPPERPQPKRLPAAEPAPPDGRPEGSRLPPRPTYDQPAYDRRPGRRSTYSGGGLMEILIGVAGAMMAGRSRGGGGSRASRATTRSGVPARRRRVPPAEFPQVPGTSRAGGPIVPSPSRPGRRRTSPTASRSSTRTRRGKVGRVRTGGRRRRS